ncbi:MAG: hypothetical protein QM744_20055 [Mesorhizobium sp.]
MNDKSDKEQKGQAEAVDAFAAATAVGFAVASRTMEMWFGAMSGFARASREILAQNKDALATEAPCLRSTKRKEPTKNASPRTMLTLSSPGAQEAKAKRAR